MECWGGGGGGGDFCMTTGPPSSAACSPREWVGLAASYPMYPMNPAQRSRLSERKNSMSKRPSSSFAETGIKRQKEDHVVLNVLLNCELSKSSETKQAHFQSLPTTPLEIKKKIEEDFSIPSCVQTLHYQSMILIL